MTEKFIETQYDVTKRSRIKKFYDSNKLLIFSSFLIIITLIFFTIYYATIKEKKAKLLSENYFQAKIYLEKGENTKAKNILKKTIYENDKTYSTLSFFLIINKNLIDDREELSELYNHILENNKHDKEIRNLLFYKKVLYEADSIDETEFLEIIKPLLNEKVLWRPHALMLAGDYFFSKKQNTKAREFYLQILTIKNLSQDIYDQATLQLALISND